MRAAWPCARPAARCASWNRWRALLPAARLGHRPAARAVGARAEVPFRDSTTPAAPSSTPGRLELADVWHYIDLHQVPYNPLHDEHFPSIGCEPCTRAVALGEDFRAGRWWWERKTPRSAGCTSAQGGFASVHMSAQPKEAKPHERPTPHRTAAARSGPRTPGRTGRRSHLHPARGGGQLRAPGAALQRRQGLLRRAAAWPRRPSSAIRAARLRRPPALPAAARGHRTQLSGSDRLSRPARGRDG
jgi:hypothetical protein